MLEGEPRGEPTSSAADKDLMAFELGLDREVRFRQKWAVKVLSMGRS